jgi:flagellar basal-body rod protein FlgF
MELRRAILNSGYYSACAGLRAQTEALELVANNLANLSTVGYRGQQATFHSLLAGYAGAGSNLLNRAINDYSVLGDTRTDLTAGNLEPTGNPLDLAMEGGGFFVVQTQAGVRYTRDGSFRVSAKNLLVSAAGDLVLGDQGPVVVPSGQVSISADGTLSVDGAVAGKLRVVEFAPGAAPVAEGSGLYSADGTAPQAATASYVRQGMLESSNVNAVLATVNLMSIQRHFEMMQGALSAYYNTFNRIAAQDLPRV